MAAENGHLDVVEILVKNGADVSIRSSLGKTPLEIAEHNHHIAVAEFLRGLPDGVRVTHFVDVHQWQDKQRQVESVAAKMRGFDSVEKYTRFRDEGWKKILEGYSSCFFIFRVLFIISTLPVSPPPSLFFDNYKSDPRPSKFKLAIISERASNDQAIKRSSQLQSSRYSR